MKLRYYFQNSLGASGHLQRFDNEMFHTRAFSGQKLIGRPEMATTIYQLFRKLLEYYKGKLSTFLSGIIMQILLYLVIQIKSFILAFSKFSIFGVEDNNEIRKSFFINSFYLSVI